MANNSDRSVEIPIYLRLDKKSYDEATAEIERLASLSSIQIQNVSGRVSRPSRTSKGVAALDFKKIFEKSLFDQLQSIDVKKLTYSLEETSQKVLEKAFKKLETGQLDIVLPKFTFSGKEFEQIKIEELEDSIQDFADQVSEMQLLSKQISELTGVPLTEIDIKNIKPDELISIFREQFSFINDKLVPTFEFLEEAYINAVGVAGGLKIGVPEIDPNRQTYSSIRTAAQSLSGQQDFLEALQKEREDLDQKLKSALKEGAKSLGTVKEFEEYTDNLVKQLDNVKRQILKITETPRVSEPGRVWKGSSGREFEVTSKSRRTLNEFRDMVSKDPEAFSDILYQQINWWTEELFSRTLRSLRGSDREIFNSESGQQGLSYNLDAFVAKFREKMLTAGFAHGSEAEFALVYEDLATRSGRKITQWEEFFLDALKNNYYSESSVNLSLGAAPAIAGQMLENPALLVSRDLGHGGLKQLKAFMAEAGNLIAEEVETKKETISQQKSLATEQKEVEQQVSSTAEKIVLASEQANNAVKLQSLSLEESLRFLMNEGKKLTAAFDTEFAYGATTPITQASIRLMDDLGNFYDVFEMVHMVPKPDENILASTRVAANNRKELESLAKALEYKQPVGSEDLAENVQQFYFKLKDLIEAINTLAKLNIPMATVAGQGADFAQGIVNSVTKVNESIDKLNLDLPKLSLPAGPYSEKTIKDPRYKAAFDGPVPAGSEIDVLKIFETLPAQVKAAAMASTGGRKTLGDLVHAFYDQFAEEFQKLIKLTEGKDAEGKLKRSFEFQGMPAHAARADTSVTAILYDLLSKMSASAPVAGGSARPPVSGIDSRRQQGIPEDGYEPFLIQLKGMNSVLSDMVEKEKEIFLAKLQGFQKSVEQQKLYERQKAIQEEIAKLEAGGPMGPISISALSAQVPFARRDEQGRAPLRGDFLFQETDKASRIKKTIEALQQEEVAIQRAGEANERRFAAEVKFSYRQDNFAAKNYAHAAQRIELSDQIADADKAAQRQIINNIKEQISAQKNLETTNKSLMNTWVTGRYALYDVGNAYENVGRNLAMVTRRIFEITNAFRSYETAFTSVERTLPALAASASGATEEMRSIKDALIDMSEVMPIAFEDLSQIATLGAQMGVSAAGIVSFTQTVAQFAAITGIATDTVAQKFGRIAELADVDYAELNNLGSSIAFAGINAVATEAEILSLAESIAAVSNMAGMLPAETIGIATSLASIGIQAEQARGVFTRVFADIDRAVSRNGDELQAFAKIAGLSVQDFAAAWGEDGESYKVFRALLGGLGATEDLTAAFDSLNIVETREINTLTRLAANLNVVDQAISDATGSFDEATFLAGAFEKTADNLDAQIQILNNNFKSFTESLSKSTSGQLIRIIKGANDLLQAFKELAKSPFFQASATMSLFITGIATAATFAISGITKLVAQMYAFRVAAINTANDAAGGTGILSMLKQITGFGSGLVEVRDGLQSIEPAARGVITPMTFTLFSNFESKQKQLLANNKLLLNSEKLGISVARQRADSINMAVRARRAEIAAVVENTALTEAERASQLRKINQNRIYATTTGEIVTGKITEAEARRRNLVAINAETSAAVTAQRGLRTSGISSILGVMTAAGAALGAITLLGTGIGLLNTWLQKTRINVLEAGGGLASLRDAIRQDTIEYQALTEEQKASSDQFTTLTVKTKEYTSELDPNAQAIAAATGASRDFVEANKKVTESISEQTIAIGNNTREWLANALMQDENVMAVLEKYPTLFKDLNEVGVDFQDALQQMFEDPGNVENPLAGIVNDTIIEMERLQSAVSLFETQGDTGLMTFPQYQAAKERIAELGIEISKLRKGEEIFNSLGDALSGALNENELFNIIRGVLGIADAADELGDELDQTEESAQGVAEALRTVLDYAGDLSGIFSRVIELEFGKQIALDAITSGWADMAESAKDAEDAIAAANAEIKDLTADRSILEYQLSVAERYGDELRAAKIRAELAKVNDQITDAEERRTEAEENGSKALTGNSEAAIRNRAALLGIIGDYQSYIETLAKLGKSSSEIEKETKTLKKQFKEQALAAGFSADEVDQYLGLFDEFATVAADTPRDVDIEVNLGLTAAEQAIAEFLAKQRSMDVGVDLDKDDAEDEIDDFLNEDRSTAPIDIDRINTLAADGSLQSWLTLRREFGAPIVTGITADAADRKIRDWLELQRILAMPRIDAIETLAADGSLKSWLTLERFFGAPKIEDITADAANIKIRDWLNKERRLANPQIHDLYTKNADAMLNTWLKKGRELSVSVKFDDKKTVLAQAQSALRIARRFPVNSVNYTSYIEMYRELMRVYNGMAMGGLVTGPGTGTSDSIPTMLSNGEFVMRASAVKQYGVDFFNSLNQQRVGFTPASTAVQALGGNSGSQIVYLSPDDRALLRAVADRPVTLYADNTKIAQSANAGNKVLSQRGVR